VKSLFLFLVPLFVLAKVHYARVEPYESVVLKAAVSGTVVDADLGSEGTAVSGKRIVHVDDALERIDLNATKQSLSLLEQTLAIDEEMVMLLEKNTVRQKGYYERIEKLPTASKTQKDTAYTSYVSVKNQYLATKEKIAGLKRQMLDLHYKLARLKDTIAKKNIVLEGQYLYKLMVRKGDFVAPGTPIARIDDAKKAKIRDEESFEIEHMEAIIAKLREMIEGGDDAIMETKTRQQTLERAKAYVYATYLALTTGRRMIEILKTLRIEKRGSEWVYCGIAKDRSEDEKCIKAYALDNDFVFLSELLQYVQEHIKETGGENMTPTQINSKFNNPFNNAFKRLTGTGFTFKDSRDIFAELLWDKEGKSGSWVDQRDFRAEVLGHEYDKSLSTPEHYMGLRGVRNEK